MRPLLVLLIGACSVPVPADPPPKDEPAADMQVATPSVSATVPGSTGSSAPAPANPCGNGIIDAGELCDDGANNGLYDHCVSDCSAIGPHCGDGVTNGPEVCDDPSKAGEPGQCSLACDGFSPAASSYPEFSYTTVAADAGEPAYRNAHRYCVPTATEPCDCAFCYPLTSTAAVDDAFVDARIRYVGHDEWQLDVHAKPTTDPNRRINFLRFPLMQFHPHDWPTVTGRLRYLTPYISGQELLAEAHPSSYAMAGLPYPGGFFSPWTVMTDDDKAIVIWASNWPPKTAQVMHGGRALEAWYTLNADPVNSQTPEPGETRTYRYTMKTVTKTADAEPWHLAVDAYTEWFKRQGVPAFEYPDWIRTVPGIYSMGLQNIQNESAGAPYNINEGLTNLIEPWKDYFKWISFWGQMSGEYGPCCTPDF